MKAKKKRTRTKKVKSIKDLIVQWKERAQIKKDPILVYNELEALREKCGGAFTPKDVVKRARKKSSVLHDLFEWDDSVAAEKFRLRQAGYIVRSLQVQKRIVRKAGEPRVVVIRQYASLGRGSGDGPKNKYHRTSDVLNVADQRDQLLTKVWMQILALRRRYSSLIELVPIWESVDEVQRHLAEIE